jgi:predicted methyltransferase
MPMSRKLWIGLALAAGLASAAVAASVPANITAALADSKRTQADKDRDALRKPGEFLAWAGVKPGQKVADFMMGGGYFTRILSPAVGPKGHVYAYQSGEFIKGFPRANYGPNQQKVVADYANVTASNEDLSALDLPDGLDLVLTVQNYHDLHLTLMKPDTAKTVNAEIFKSLKPGGTYVVVDHVANAGTGMDAPNKIHRIDPAIIKQEVTAAGFKYEGESTLLRDPADTHDKMVFDPSIRGKTDQVAYKFRKPR